MYKVKINHGQSYRKLVLLKSYVFLRNLTMTITVHAIEKCFWRENASSQSEANIKVTPKK